MGWLLGVQTQGAASSSPAAAGHLLWGTHAHWLAAVACQLASSGVQPQGVMSGSLQVQLAQGRLQVEWMVLGCWVLGWWQLRVRCWGVRVQVLGQGLALSQRTAHPPPF